MTMTDKKFTGKYVDPRAEGQRQGAIGHYASRLVHALIIAGQVNDEEQAVRSFNRLVSLLEKDFGKV